MFYTGRRGSISLENDIATKRANSIHTKGALQKEILLLQQLAAHHITFVPQIIDSGDDRFSYTRLPGEHFTKTMDQSNPERQTKLLQTLLEHAYGLDQLGIIHGELDDPRSNVLVDEHDNVRIIDFERGRHSDASGKNLRHLAQYFYRHGYITRDQLQRYGAQDIPTIYHHLFDSLMHTKTTTLKTSFTYTLLFVVLLIAIDQLTKRVFYNQARGEQYRLLTPVLNPGVGRSIPLPLRLSLIIGVCFVVGISYAFTKYAKSSTALIFLLAGAVGNLIDRAIVGGVRDFIDLHYRPVFNAADIFLTIGVILLLRDIFIIGRPVGPLDH